MTFTILQQGLEEPLVMLPRLTVGVGNHGLKAAWINNSSMQT